MKILIEEHRYKAELIKDVLDGINVLENIDGYVSLNYVGYYYNSVLNDCVFILPKVLMEDKEGEEMVFSNYRPEDIIDIDSHNPLTAVEKNFLYEFSVWIYRSIVVFHENNRQSDIVYYKKIIQMGNNSRRLSNTYLDILLALINFNKNNKDFFFFILRNLHSGYNKINWTRTISTADAIVQNNTPIYLRPVNKKRKINFDEELLVIFFSIINYIGDEYGFTKEIDCNYQLIKGMQFEHYLNGYGKIRLLQIKYKYYSDKALELWELCYAFFVSARKIRVNTDQREYLLVKNFNIVFEAIIDELIGDKNIPAGLKEQEDGKLVDHLYTYKSLTSYEDKPVYYIGDSKYYKRGHKIGRESVYKQFTYARNVIQWNLNLFSNEDEDADLRYDKRNFGNVAKLRDDLTEGYNIIPNFFISAKLNKDLSYDDRVEAQDGTNIFQNRQFKNRLFDRDTLLVYHYNVNFLFVISLYARNNVLQKREWKSKMRNMFRNEIQKQLSKKFTFYGMKAHQDTDAKRYFREHFQEILGKVYTPFSDTEIYSLALDRSEKFSEENEKILAELRRYFYIEPCGIGTNPSEKLAESAQRKEYPSSQLEGVLMVMMMNFDDKAEKFLQNGKIAVALKYTKDSMKIVKNLSKIEYVLFHTWNDENQHLFSKVGNLRIMSKEEISDEYYFTNREADLYVVLQINQKELNPSNLHCRNVEVDDPSLRYDARYSTITELQADISLTRD